QHHGRRFQARVSPGGNHPGDRQTPGEDRRQARTAFGEEAVKKLIGLLLVAVLARAGTAQTGAAPASDPALAVVRIKSHGASGTVIATAPGKSWILSCCHMFFGGGDQ